MDMTDEIRKVIESNLPAHTAGVLKEFIFDAQQVKSEFEQLFLENQNLLTKKEQLEKRVKELEPLETREKEIEKKEQELWKMEKTNELKIMEIKLRCAEEKTIMIQNLADTVFRNPRLSYSEHGSVPYVGRNGYVESGLFSKSAAVEEIK